MTENPKCSPDCPRFVVCEDGEEYVQRFERFLGADFEFIPVRDFASLLVQIEQRAPISAILLDLDFRRVDATALVDEHGHSVPLVGKESLASYVANQGLFILASLRERGIGLRVLLFADMDDKNQRDYLELTFAPLELVPSHVGMGELKVRLTELGAGPLTLNANE